jgi:hypothetical protein
MGKNGIVDILSTNTKMAMANKKNIAESISPMIEHVLPALLFL